MPQNIVNFLFGTRGPQGFNITGAVSFEADLTIQENHERKSNVTDHPIESGSKITDHVILQPEELNLTGFVTDARPEIAGARLGRTLNAFSTLEDAWNAGQPMTVITGYRTYQNMIITDMRLPKNQPSSMQFKIKMRGITIVQSETANLPNTDSQDTTDRASPKKDAGRQSTSNPGSSTDNRASSIIRRWQDDF